jgi:hypothetical protein
MSALPHLAAEPVVSLRMARETLSVGPRRIRQLIESGRLTAIGNGPGRKVSLRSLETEIAKRKAEVEAAIEAKPHNPSEQLRQSSLPNEAECLENGGMDYFPSQSVTSNDRLVPISEAARIVGLSPALMARVVRDGDVPVIQIGGRKRINTVLLQRWARSTSRRG